MRSDKNPPEPKRPRRYSVTELRRSRLKNPATPPAPVCPEDGHGEEIESILFAPEEKPPARD